MAIAELIPTFDLLQLILVGFAFFLGSLMMHLIAAKVVYSHPKFLNKVAVGVMSSAFVKMTTGKLLKKVVNGITEAIGNVEMPDIGNIMKELPPDLLEKIPPGIIEGAKGGMEGMEQLLGAVQGLTGGGKEGGGMPDLGGLMDMFKMFGGAGKPETPSGGKGGYNPGG